jgi:hypothetical protein
MKRFGERVSTIEAVLLFIKGGTTKEGGKNERLDIEQIYCHGSQRGSMPGVTLLAGCQQ